MLLVPQLVLAHSLFLTGGLLADDPAKVDFATQVKPIFEARCVECHGEKKAKGRLRLDSKESAFAAPKKNKKARVVAGHPEESSIYGLVSLPKDDPDIMPAEGEPLTAAQIAILKAWIEQGANWPDAGGTPAPEPKANPDGRPPEPAVTSTADGFGLPALSDADRASEEAAMSKVAARGGLALRIASNSTAVEVNLSLLGPQVTDADLALLAGVEKDLVWLNLSRTAVSDAGLATLAGFQRLRRLNLSNTKVTDAAIASIAALPELEYLNLYGTSVTDAGLGGLKGLQRLRDVYVWQTAVTADGAKALADSLPSVRIDRGVYEAAKSEPVEIAADPSAAAKPAPVNKTCPVSGAAIDAGVTVTVDGQVIAFCCNNCKAQFEKDPAALLPKIAEFKPTAAAIPATSAAAPAAGLVVSGTLQDLDGNVVDLAVFAGKVVLCVNTASLGRNASQLAGLQSLHAAYHDRGLEVLAFPSDDFGNQEPGDAKAIADFARRQYGVKFTILAKGSVRSGGNGGLFDRLAQASGHAPNWNFEKYLVAKDGKTVTHFGASVSPDGRELRAAIEDALAR